MMRVRSQRGQKYVKFYPNGQLKETRISLVESHFFQYQIETCQMLKVAHKVAHKCFLHSTLKVPITSA